MSAAHPDLDALADLLAGEGSADDVSHVGSCAACAARLAALDDALPAVAASLAGAPAAPPAPDDLLDRVRAAVAAEPRPADPVARVPAGALPTSGDVLPGGVVPLRPRPARRPPAALGLAAGALGLLALVGLGVGLGRGGGSADSAASSGSRDTTLEAAAPAGLPSSASGNDYGPDGRRLVAALPGLLSPGAAGGSAADSTLSLPAPVAGTTGADPLARLRQPDELAGCLSGLSGPGTDGVPLALDYARFQGQPALVVVLPSARDGKVDVFVVGAGCRAGDDRTLFFSRLDRP